MSLPTFLHVQRVAHVVIKPSTLPVGLCGFHSDLRILARTREASAFPVSGCPLLSYACHLYRIGESFLQSTASLNRDLFALHRVGNTVAIQARSPTLGYYVFDVVVRDKRAASLCLDVWVTRMVLSSVSLEIGCPCLRTYGFSRKTIGAKIRPQGHDRLGIAACEVSRVGSFWVFSAAS